jgi:hypothetical protein
MAGLAVVLAAVSAVMLAGMACAQVIAVPNGDAVSAPTQTLFWESANAQATLIFIPGGEGQLGLKPTQKDTRNDFYQSLKKLTENQGAGAGTNVVLFDSPEALDSNPRGYPVSRATNDHLSRIGSILRFYKLRAGRPVWLMGHSNGAVSVTEFTRFKDFKNEPSLLSGVVVSGARTGSHFEGMMNSPILFLHHEKDGCRNASPTASHKNFEKAKLSNTAATRFVFIHGGSDTKEKSPCDSGYHMYNGAEMEMVDAVRDFLLLNPSSVKKPQAVDLESESRGAK